MAITAKEAARIAGRYYGDISNEMVELSIEEIERDGGFWYITLGVVPTGFPSIGMKGKSFKIFKIDAEDGEVLSMKIRDIGK